MQSFVHKLVHQKQTYLFYNLESILGQEALNTLPFSLRLLVENMARKAPHALNSFLGYLRGETNEAEAMYYPNRLMFHDTTCLPALADFAGMRNMLSELGGDPNKINPAIEAVLVIDHSVIVEAFGSDDSLDHNLDSDYSKNSERYEFIKWAQKSLDNFKVVPPGTGIIHQVNIEFLAQPILTSETDQGTFIHPDNMVATDSHTPMINGVGVLAWGVGGIEGQAALLGEPITLSLPKVVGVHLTGTTQPGVTAMDVALTLAQMFRSHGVVGKFIEFHGEGVANLDWAGRATISNMAPEYGATVVYFPIDDEAMSFFAKSGRSKADCDLAKHYYQAQKLWHENTETIRYDETLALDLSKVEPSVAGPHLPHEHLPLSQLATSYRDEVQPAPVSVERDTNRINTCFQDNQEIDHGLVAIAAITSCTNAGNPRELIQAGLFARNAVANGLLPKAWVKTSFSPASKVARRYLDRTGLQRDLDQLGFNITGFGCMTCIGNSGDVLPEVDRLISQGVDCIGVLSGNRNFQGRVNPRISNAYLMSPVMTIAFALAGNVKVSLTEATFLDKTGQSFALMDLMPSDQEVEQALSECMATDDYQQELTSLWNGDHRWQTLNAQESVLFPWKEESNYLRRPQYLQSVPAQKPGASKLAQAKVLMHLGDNITTDHISPASSIPKNSLAGEYLIGRGEDPSKLNQFSTRRSNHEVMLRGAFINPKLVNKQTVAQGKLAVLGADGKLYNSVYQGAQTHIAENQPLMIFAGRNFGSGSSRDWAAKSQALLGVKAIVAISFERIHRSNLIGMGVLPLIVDDVQAYEQLTLQGTERIDVSSDQKLNVGHNQLMVNIEGQHNFSVSIFIDSKQELEYLEHQGILPFMLRKKLEA
ncbi:aconitate hydratase [Marinomonas gallaica]|uniref:aconitate hydratase n=1 Tax=Marinomonas gallaica TaxID=1806667 RepID=UPI003A918EB3